MVAPCVKRRRAREAAAAAATEQVPNESVAPAAADPAPVVAKPQPVKKSPPVRERMVRKERKKTKMKEE
jgi:hypothetical protein